MRVLAYCILFGALLAWVAPASAAHVPAAVSLSGALENADGSPVLQSNVRFRLSLYDASDTCLLYSEIQPPQDLSYSRGRFALMLGTGSSAVNRVSGTGQLDVAVFANPGSTTVSGCGVIALNPGDVRRVRVEYDLGSGYVAMNPSVAVVTSAYSLVAETLAGMTPDQFLQVATNGSTALSQSNAQYAFSSVNWPRLKALLDGASTQYLATSGTTGVDLGGRRLNNLLDPVAAQDAVTKNYADTKLGGRALDLTGVGPAVGGGSTLVWDQVANQWAVGTVSTTPTGSAGGDLAGTYPNPTIAANAVSSAKINSTGIGVNRLLITDATTGARVGFGTCAIGEVYAWTATGFACTSGASLSPVQTVAGRTGAVLLTAADITGLGTAALYDYGTAANQIPRLDASARLPAVDGSLLANVNAISLRGRAVATTAPVPGQVLEWNGTAWTPAAAGGGSVTNVEAGAGLLGGPISSTGTLSVDVGTTANKIVQLNASAQIPAVDGSLVTNVNAVQLRARAVAATAPFTGAVLGWNASATQWEPTAASVGSVTNVVAGAGLLGGPVTSTGTLSVDVGTAANKILQLNASAQIPAVDGSLLTGVNAVQLRSRSVAATAPFTGAVLGWNASATQWEPTTASAGSVTNVAAGVGLLGGPVTSTGTLSVDVGTAANKILQLNASAQIPAVDGSLVTNVNAIQLRSHAVAATTPFTGAVLGWNASATQWEPTTASAGSVTNVAAGVGLLGGPVTSTGTLSVDVGTAANKILQLNSSAQIPAVDASLLTNVNAVQLRSRSVAATAPAAGQVIGWNDTQSEWQPMSVTSGTITGVTAGTGLLGGSIVTNGTISVDVGTAANKILQLNASAQVPAVDGSLLTNVNAAQLRSRAVASTAPFTGAVLGWNQTATQWEPVLGTSGSVTSVAAGTGLLGGPVTSTGTLSVDVGTAANKILQLNASAQIPAVDGSLLTGVNAVQLQARAVAATAPTVGQVLGWNGTQSQWQPVSVTSGTVMNVAAGAGLLGGPITSVGTLAVDVGTGANQILQLNGLAQIRAVDGSLLTNVRLGTRAVATTAPVTGQVLGWNQATTVWEPTSAAVGSVTSVVASTGLTGGTITSSGTLAVDVGTAANKILQLNGSAQIPAVDGSLLNNVNAFTLRSRAVATTTPFAGSVLGWNQTLLQWEPVLGTTGAVTSVSAGVGLSGGPVTSVGTLNVDVGTAANKILQLNASAQIPAVDGSLLTGVNAVKLQAQAVASTVPSTGSVLGWNGSLAQWEPTPGATGSVTRVATGLGLTGGPITASGTLGVDVGSSAGKIVQENANAQIAQLAGSAGLPAYAFAGTNAGVFSPGANALALATNGTAALTVLGDGTVGIGTTAPLSQLFVTGGSIVDQSTATTTANINVSRSNVVTSSTAASTINICGLVDGGAYSVILTGLTNGATITVNAFTSAACTGAATVDMGAGATTFSASGNTTILNFIYVTTTTDAHTLYGTSTGGFNVR